MHEDKGQIKKWSDLTEEELKSGKWKPYPEALAKPMSKSNQRREEYMQKVQAKLDDLERQAKELANEVPTK